VKSSIAKALYELLEVFSYKDINIRVICETVPISRPTFYYHFTNKDSLVKWMFQQDFQNNAVPLFKYHLKEIGVQSFFTYIQQNKLFYQRIYEYDNGMLFFDSLIAAYDSGTDVVDSYSLPSSHPYPKINPEIYRRYSNTGIASVVTYWVQNDMSIPIDKMANDLFLMMGNSLEVVRDNCLSGK
jgi:hypothetical protein